MILKTAFPPSETCACLCSSEQTRLLQLYHAEHPPIAGALRSPQHFQKIFPRGEKYITFPPAGDKEGNPGCAPPLLPRFIASVSPNLGWWGSCCMTRHMSGPLREKPALTLAGFVFFAWPCPSLCHSWHLPARPPLTSFMPLLAGMWLVYLLWPAARVKGSFCPHSGRGWSSSRTMGEVLGKAAVCLCTDNYEDTSGVYTWEAAVLWAVAWQDAGTVTSVNSLLGQREERCPLIFGSDRQTWVT